MMLSQIFFILLAIALAYALLNRKKIKPPQYITLQELRFPVFSYYCPDQAFVPYQATSGAAGFDLKSSQRVDLAPGKSALIRSGVFPIIPHGWVGLICPRSSMAAKHNIRIGARVIDSDFRGEMFIDLHNDGEDFYEIKKGDRVAQIILLPHIGTGQNLTEQQWELLSNTQRGAGELGSTGR